MGAEGSYKGKIKTPLKELTLQGIRGLAFVAEPTFRNKAVTHPGFCLNVLAAGFVFELFAKLSDEDAEVFGLIGRLSTPNRGEESAVGHDFAGIPREMHKELEFFGSEVNRLALHGHGVRLGIDDKVSRLDGCGGALGSATQVSTHTGEEFLDAKGLGNVVIRTGVERFHLGTLMIADRENQQRS